MNLKFDEFRNLYSEFIYEKYEILEKDDYYEISYYYNIPNLETFNPKMILPKKIITRKNINEKFLNNLVFHIGLVESISYYKCVCPKNFIIRCGNLNEEQINWFKKLFFNGLGEFLYRNNIDINMDNFFDVIIDNNYDSFEQVNFDSEGNLICVGGGKDSCVSLELLKNEKENSCFFMNGKRPMFECAKVAGYKDDEIYDIKRIIDKEKIIKLNKLGYLNGHIPISSVIAFISYLVAYLSCKKNIILSNESSANESYVKDKFVNHQYSKSFEFEKDFFEYTTKYFCKNINYISLLRPLSELQIAYLFSKYEKYHSVFKSCNLGSKESEWIWCLNCSKCLFAYIILSPFLSYEKLNNIFGENLLNKKELLDDFVGLTGNGDNKPFECVGTYEEVIYCINKTIKKYLNNKLELPYLLEYYKNNYELIEIDDKILTKYNNENNLNEHFERIIKEAIENE